MKTFLINEQYKKTTKGGKGLCRVFLIEKSKGSGNTCLYEITEKIAILLGREKQYDGKNLTIYYGSGTGQTIISEIIKENWSDDVGNIVDVSIF